MPQPPIAGGAALRPDRAEPDRRERIVPARSRHPRMRRRRRAAFSAAFVRARRCRRVLVDRRLRIRVELTREALLVLLERANPQINATSRYIRKTFDARPLCSDSRHAMSDDRVRVRAYVEQRVAIVAHRMRRNRIHHGQGAASVTDRGRRAPVRVRATAPPAAPTPSNAARGAPPLRTQVWSHQQCRPCKCLLETAIAAVANQLRQIGGRG